MVPIFRHTPPHPYGAVPRDLAFPLGRGEGGWGRPELSIIINVLEPILRNNADFLGPVVPGPPKWFLTLYTLNTYRGADMASGTLYAEYL